MAKFDRVGMDLIGGLSRTARGKNYILVIVDHYSRYLVAVAIPNKEAETVAQAFWEHWVSRFGFPSSILSDQGTEFVNSTLSRLSKLNRVEHLTTGAYHPEGNGLVERANGTLVSMLRKVVMDSGRQWDITLPSIVLAYNTAVHTSTGESPYWMLFGQEPRMLSDYLLGVNVSRRDQGEGLVERLQAVYERVHRALEGRLAGDRCDDANVNVEVGDLVLLKREQYPAKSKSMARWQGPFVVLAKEGVGICQLKECMTGFRTKVPVSRLFVYLAARDFCSWSLNESWTRKVTQKVGKFVYAGRQPEMEDWKYVLWLPKYDQCHELLQGLVRIGGDHIVAIPTWNVGLVKRIAGKAMEVVLNIAEDRDAFLLKGMPVGVHPFPVTLCVLRFSQLA
jgi:hypothetical protein